MPKKILFKIGYTSAILTIDNKLNSDEYSIKLKNYPNPFNSNTIIDFYITNDSKVDLKIFDIMGNLIRNLVSDRMPAGLKNTIVGARGGVAAHTRHTLVSAETKAWRVWAATQ